VEVVTPNREATRLQLSACLCQALALFPNGTSRRVTFKKRANAARGRIIIDPLTDENGADDVPLPGQHFSPLGAAIWGALAAGPLPGKKIAAKCGLTYTPGFAVILKEYVDRGVLGHNRKNGGYFRKVTTNTSRSDNDKSQ
jgi:hypothetical protein